MEAFTSPFIVPIGAFAVAIVAIVASHISQSHARRLKAEQRLAMVARGLPAQDIERMLGPTAVDDASPRPRDPLRGLAIARRWGIILISTGVGTMLFFLALVVILKEREILAGAACGLVPVAIGVGFFIDYNLQKRELSRFGLEVDTPR